MKKKRKPKPKYDRVLLGGWFDVVARERGKVAWRERVKNGLTEAALELAITQLQDGEATLNWGFGLIDNDDFEELAFTDTLETHAGWTEFTDYTVVETGSATARPQWTPTHPVTNQLITTDSASTFEMTVSATLAGVFLCNSVIKSIVLEKICWATGLFDAPRHLPIGGTITSGYTCAIEVG